MMLVDANVLMYANGREHPNKPIAVEFLRRVASKQTEAIIDAEVLQEILHRYLSLRRMREALEVFDMARVLFPNVLPITVSVMDQARDAIHAAVVSI